MRNAASVCFGWYRIVLGVMLGLAGGAVAQAADMYRIQGVPVDATADSGVAARELAITAGEREGLARLLQRLTAPSTHAQLPNVADRPIEPYVNSYEIAQEKVGPNRYLGQLNISYVAAAVQGLLDDAGIPYVIRRSDPILVVPIEIVDGKPVAWVDTSPWRAAWYDGIEQATVTVLSLPLGDLGDIATATPEAIMGGDRASLEALAARYGTQSVIVAAARPMGAATPEQPAAVEITVRRADGWNRPLLKTVVQPAPNETSETILARAVSQVIAAIENDWKEQTVGRNEALGTLPVVVSLAGLPAWVQIRHDLGEVAEVRSVTLDSFTQTQARVTLGYVGDLEPLMAAVQRVGLSLVQESDGWRLHPADDPAAWVSPPYVSPATP